MYYQWKSVDGTITGESSLADVAHQIATRLSKGELGIAHEVVITIQPEGRQWRRYRDGEYEDLTNEKPRQPKMAPAGGEPPVGTPSGYELNQAWEQHLDWEQQLIAWGLPKEAVLKRYFIVFLEDDDSPTYWTVREEEVDDIIEKARRRKAKMRIEDSRNRRVVAQLE